MQRQQLLRSTGVASNVDDLVQVEVAAIGVQSPRFLINR